MSPQASFHARRPRRAIPVSALVIAARATLVHDSRRLVRTQFVTDKARADLVDALLKVHGKERCGHGS